MAARFTRHDGAALALLLVGIGLIFGRFLLPAPAFILPNSDLGTDLPREIYPLAQYMGDVLRTTGTLPLWRPYALSGFPLFAHPINPALYPGQWLAALLPIPFGLNVIAIAHLWIAGAGVYAIARFLHGYDRSAALVGAGLFALAPRMVLHVGGGHWWLISALAWLPWLYFCAAAYWHTRRPVWAIGCGLALAFITMNNTNYLPLLAVFIVPAALIALIGTRERAQALRTLLSLGTITGVIAVGLTAAQVLPALAYLPQTTRFNSLSLAEAQASLAPVFALGILLPFKLELTEAFLYAGIGLLLLPVIGAAGWTRRERGWALAAGAALLLTFGTNGGLYSALAWVPGFSLLRGPERFYPFALLALSVLAAHGWQHWRTAQPIPRWMRLTLVTAAALGLALTGAEIALGGALPFYVFPQGVLLTTAAVLLLTRPRGQQPLLIVVLALDLAWLSASLLTPGARLYPASDPVIAAMTADREPEERAFNPYALLSDAALYAAGIPTVDGYNTAPMQTYADFMRVASGCPYADYTAGIPPMRASAEAAAACPTVTPRRDLLAMLNTRYLIERAALPGLTPILTTPDGRRLYDLGPGYGPAWSAPAWSPAPPSSADCAAALPMTAYPAVPETVLIDAPPPAAITPGTRLVITGYTRTVNGATVTVDAPSGGLLIRAEAFAPGVRVRVDDGEWQPAAVANCALQAAWVPAGAQTVTFDYQPALLPLGTAISAITAVLVLLTLGLLGFRAGRRTR